MHTSVRFKYLAKILNCGLISCGLTGLFLLAALGRTAADTNDDAAYRAIFLGGSQFTGILSELMGFILVQMSAHFPEIPSYSLYLFVMLCMSYLVFCLGVVRFFTTASPLTPLFLLLGTVFHILVCERFGVTAISILAFVSLSFTFLTRNKKIQIAEIALVVFLLSGRVLLSVYLLVIVFYYLGSILSRFRVSLQRVIVLALLVLGMNFTKNVGGSSWPDFNDARFALSEMTSTKLEPGSPNLELFLQWWAHDEELIPTDLVIQESNQTIAFVKTFPSFSAWKVSSDTEKIFVLYFIFICVFGLMLLAIQNYGLRVGSKSTIAPFLFVLLLGAIDFFRPTWRVTIPLSFGALLLAGCCSHVKDLQKRGHGPTRFFVLAASVLVFFSSYRMLRHNLGTSLEYARNRVEQVFLKNALNSHSDRGPVGILSIQYPCGNAAQSGFSFALFDEEKLVSFREMVPVGWLARHPIQKKFFKDLEVDSMAELIASGKGIFVCPKDSVFDENTLYKILLTKHSLVECRDGFYFEKEVLDEHYDTYRWACKV